jgi:predicted kinase
MDPPEAVILAGIPASGKTSYYRERLLDTHVRISRDLLRTRHREEVFLAACLETRQPFAVDKLNPTARERAPYIARARAAGFRVLGVWLDVPPRLAAARNDARPPAARVPLVAVFGTAKQFEPPQEREGFDAVERVGHGG